MKIIGYDKFDNTGYPYGLVISTDKYELGKIVGQKAIGEIKIGSIINLDEVSELINRVNKNLDKIHEAQISLRSLADALDSIKNIEKLIKNVE